MQAQQLLTHNVCLGFPGTNFHFMAIGGVLRPAQRNNVIVRLAGAPCGNFNALWAEALNLYEAGEITHFAMLHSDIAPDPDWIDTLLEEMDRLNAALISVAVPLKDQRGVMSCGVGEQENPWSPLRRVTVKELLALPPTFNAADFGYPDHVLLHNNGCWAADLRFKEFFATDSRGYLKAVFDFPTRIYRHGTANIWGTDGESEDWYFSRMLHEIGLRNTYITRKVKVSHIGTIFYSNVEDRGTYRDGDTDTRWCKNGHKEKRNESETTPLARLGMETPERFTA